jgi:hypothetical protein
MIADFVSFSLETAKGDGFDQRFDGVYFKNFRDTDDNHDLYGYTLYLRKEDDLFFLEFVDYASSFGMIRIERHIKEGETHVSVMNFFQCLYDKIREMEKSAPKNS